MLLTFLGKGSAFNTKEGNTSAYIKDGSSLLLIDCGETVFGKIRELNLLDGIDDVNVLITHLHSDHVGSLSSLIFYCHFVKKIHLKLYYPTEEILAYLHVSGNDKFQYDFISLHRLGGIQVTPSIKVRKHTTDHVYGMNSFGYYITYNDITIFYSGDSNEISNPHYKIKDCDEVYQDTCLAHYPGNVHLSLKNLCEYIPEEYRHKVYCMHYDCDELKDEIIKEGFNLV